MPTILSFVGGPTAAGLALLDDDVSCLHFSETSNNGSCSLSLTKVDK